VRCSGTIRAAWSGNSGPRPGGGSVLSGVQLVTMVGLFVFCRIVISFGGEKKNPPGRLTCFSRL